MSLITEAGGVNPHLITLVRKTIGINVSKEITPENMNVLLQQKWKKDAPFRVNIKGDPPTEDYVEIFRQLDCIDEIRISNKKDAHPTYDGVLFPGGVLHRVRTRLLHLIEEYKSGAYFKKIYLLGSERALIPEHENPQSFQVPPEGYPVRKNWNRDNIPLPTNEIEVMEYVIKQTNIPQAWKTISVKTLDVSLPEGKSRPANTGDTYVQWQKDTGSTSGVFLIASNQPFVRYQEVIARRILPPEMTFVGIGHAANLKLPFATFLDDIAKRLWEECLIRQRSK